MVRYYFILRSFFDTISLCPFDMSTVSNTLCMSRPTISSSSQSAAAAAIKEPKWSW